MKKIISLTLAFQLLISMGSCKNESPESADGEILPDSGILVKVPKEEFASLGMRLDTIGLASFPETITTNGVIEVPPNNRATINAFLGGYVKDISLLVGDRVRKGQKLLTLENLEFLELQQEYLEAGQRLTYLEAEYERQKELYEENINSKKVFMKAENEYEKIRIERQALGKKLRMIQIDPDRVSSDNLVSTTAIYSPIEGSVTKVMVNTGTHVTPDEPIMEIVNSDHLHLEIQIFEKDALAIEKGQKISFRVPEYSDQEFSAEVSLIGRSIDQDRTVKVHAHLTDHKKSKFIPGMFIQADITTEEKVKPALPSASFVNFEGKDCVLELVDENPSTYTFRKIEVNKGAEQGGFIEVDLPASDEKKQYLTGFSSPGS